VALQTPFSSSFGNSSKRLIIKGDLMIKFIFISILFFVSLATAVDHHSSHKEKKAEQDLVNRKFIATSDLRLRMDKILSLTKELNPKKDDVKVVKSYGDKITETVNDIFKTCKLEPDADAAIHPPLGLILEGASDFKNGNYESGHKKIHEAFLNYEKIFKLDDKTH
jgi:hypothetical protein